MVLRAHAELRARPLNGRCLLSTSEPKNQTACPASSQVIQSARNGVCETALNAQFCGSARRCRPASACPDSPPTAAPYAHRSNKARCIRLGQYQRQCLCNFQSIAPRRNACSATWGYLRGYALHTTKLISPIINPLAIFCGAHLRTKYLRAIIEVVSVDSGTLPACRFPDAAHQAR